MSSNHDEVERKFLVTDATILQHASAEFIEQGYLFADGGYAVRVRRRFLVGIGEDTSEGPAELAFKGPKRGSARREYEIKVENDPEFIQGLLKIAPFKLTKLRYAVVDGGQAWDVDVFQGSNQGLIVAELERPRAYAVTEFPEWCGKEVTGDERFNNENLAQRPFSEWRLGL